MLVLIKNLVNELWRSIIHIIQYYIYQYFQYDILHNSLLSFNYPINYGINNNNRIIRFINVNSSLNLINTIYYPSILGEKQDFSNSSEIRELPIIFHIGRDIDFNKIKKDWDNRVEYVLWVIDTTPAINNLMVGLDEVQSYVEDLIFNIIPLNFSDLLVDNNIIIRLDQSIIEASGVNGLIGMRVVWGSYQKNLLRSKSVRIIGSINYSPIIYHDDVFNSVYGDSVWRLENDLRLMDNDSELSYVWRHLWINEVERGIKNYIPSFLPSTLIFGSRMDQPFITDCIDQLYKGYLYSRFNSSKIKKIIFNRDCGFLSYKFNSWLNEYTECWSRRRDFLRMVVN